MKHNNDAEMMLERLFVCIIYRNRSYKLMLVDAGISQKKGEKKDGCKDDDNMTNNRMQERERDRWERGN